MMTKKWTDEEINLVKNGINPEGRSESSIKNMRLRLGIVKYKSPKWTPEHKEQLKTLLKEGKSTKEISEILPYTQKSVQKEIVRQNLPHTKSYRFTTREKQEFIKFLRKNWQQKTPNELMLLWNDQYARRYNARKVNAKKIVTYLIALNLRVDKSEIMKFTLLKKREKELYEDPTLDKNKAIDEIKRKRIKIMADRFAQGKDIWTGRVLQQQPITVVEDCIDDN